MINFGLKVNVISTFSLLSPFTFYDFSIVRLWGLLCFSLSRSVRFLVVLGSLFEPSGLPFGPLASDVFRFGFHFAPVASFSFLLASFGFLWLRLVPFGLILAPFLLPLAPF